jgi:ribosomal protein S18 acetylase RimI-like enzyme
MTMPAAQTPFTIRLAIPDDLAAIDWLDTFGTSPHRNISRSVAQYFGSVDPSIHERNLIFLAEVPSAAALDLPYRAVGKVEVLLAPASEPSEVGYIKRVVVQPAWRKLGVARAILRHVIAAAPDLGVRYLDLHVGEDNTPALHLYEALGFAERHRELYLRLEVDAPPSERTLPRDPAT